MRFFLVFFFYEFFPVIFNFLLNEWQFPLKLTPSTLVSKFQQCSIKAKSMIDSLKIIWPKTTRLLFSSTQLSDLHIFTLNNQHQNHHIGCFFSSSLFSTLNDKWNVNDYVATWPMFSLLYSSLLIFLACVRCCSKSIWRDTPKITMFFLKW